MSISYILQRTLPSGVTKVQETWSKGEAADLAGYVLHDNLGVGKAEAQTFAAQLYRAPLGAALEAHGYTFKIVRAA